MIRKTRKSTTWAVILMLALLLSCLPVSAVFAAAHTTVTIDGRALQLDVPPTIIEGRTLVPLRAIFEALGADVEWNSATRTVTGRKGATTIILPIGSRYPTVNGVPVELDVPGIIVDGRTLVPARFIAESLGAQVDWMPETRTVVIASGGIPITSPEVPTSPPVVEEKAPEAQDLESRIEREPIVAYFGKSMDEIRAAFGTWTHNIPGAQYFYSADVNYMFWFEGGKVTAILLLGYHETDEHNFLGFDRGITPADVISVLGEPDSQSSDSGNEYYTYYTAKYQLNFVEGYENPGIIESIEIYPR